MPLPPIKAKYVYLAAALSGYNMQVSAADHLVEIKDFAFSPSELTVQSGDTVTWVNKDFVPHNIAGGTVNIWRSPNLKKGEMFSLVVLSDIPYLCSLHAASMNGTILVQDP